MGARIILGELMTQYGETEEESNNKRNLSDYALSQLIYKRAKMQGNRNSSLSSLLSPLSSLSAFYYLHLI
jgi:hypothetical protein